MKTPEKLNTPTIANSLDVLDILTIVLVAAKAFGFCNITWAQALAPLWLPWAILLWFALLAGVITVVKSKILGWVLWVLFTFCVMSEFV